MAFNPEEDIYEPLARVIKEIKKEKNPLKIIIGCDLRSKYPNRQSFHPLLTEACEIEENGTICFGHKGEEENGETHCGIGSESFERIEREKHIKTEGLLALKIKLCEKEELLEQLEEYEFPSKEDFDFCVRQLNDVFDMIAATVQRGVPDIYVLK